jgi:hypothetical protein
MIFMTFIIKNTDKLKKNDQLKIVLQISTVELYDIIFYHSALNRNSILTFI